jgi:hypothetical protein
MNRARCLFFWALYYSFWGLVGYGLLVLNEPMPPKVPQSNCTELLRMYPDMPPAHVVIKCKGLV